MALVNNYQKGILIHGFHDKSYLKKIEDDVSFHLDKKSPQDFFSSIKNIDIEKWNSNVMTKNDGEIAEIKEKVVLFKPAKRYKTNMYPWDLYDCTRGIWQMGDRRNIVDYAFAAYKGKIVETCKVISCIEGGKSYGHSPREWETSSRWEFIGYIDYKMRNKYLSKSIEYKGQKFKYFNCDF
ncbi:MAG: hypothetical protein OXC92_05835 [Flavobacteriaceae bacterium]|nr:hypothetical protein [Flavobacteriaceae bacterium]MCY4253597.1 hypothetical protein [Flavobacteriaceae bacterium]